MYSYRDYSASSRRNHKVTENGTMGRHTSSSPPPVLGDGKRRSIRDRLQGITTAMSWIKDELNDLKESDRALIDIFKQLQGDVGELNSYVSTHRSSGSVSGVAAVKEEKVQAQSMDTSLELDFSVLDSAPQNGELDDETFSDTPSPVEEIRGFTESGNSSNLDVHVGSSRDNLYQSSNHTHQDKDNQRTESMEDLLEPPSGLSISLGSLDLDFSTTAFGLGTITEGGSMMNLPTNTTASSSGSSKGSSPSSNKQRGGNFQRSLSQQPLPGPDIVEKTRKLSHQPPKPPPQTLPKPRRGSWFSRKTPPPQKKPSVTSKQRPVITLVRQNSGSSTGSPQAPRKDISAPLQANKGSASPSPPEQRKEASSPPQKRSKESKVMKPILSAQAQQELKDVARQLKHDSKSSKSAQKIPNGAAPQFQREPDGSRSSPLLQRRQPPSQPKQPSPPLSSRVVESPGRAKPPVPRTSPPHPQRVSPTPARPQVHVQLSAASELKGSSSMNRLTPSALKAQEETLSNISRNSSIDSGIQFASEGENGGAVHADSGTSRGNTGSTVGGTTSGGGNDVKLGGGDDVKLGGGDSVKLGGGDDTDGLGFGDFASDVFSALASKSWMTS